MIRQNDKYKLYCQNHQKNQQRGIKFELMKKQSFPSLHRKSIIQDLHIRKSNNGNRKSQFKAELQKLPKNNNRAQNSIILVDRHQKEKFLKQKNINKMFYKKTKTQINQNQNDDQKSLSLMKKQYYKQLRDMKIIEKRLKIHHILNKAIQQACQKYSSFMEVKDYTECFNL